MAASHNNKLILSFKWADPVSLLACWHKIDNQNTFHHKSDLTKKWVWVCAFASAAVPIRVPSTSRLLVRTPEPQSPDIQGEGDFLLHSSKKIIIKGLVFNPFVSLPVINHVHQLFTNSPPVDLNTNNNIFNWLKVIFELMIWSTLNMTLSEACLTPGLGKKCTLYTNKHDYFQHGWLYPRPHKMGIIVNTFSPEPQVSIFALIHPQLILSTWKEKLSILHSSVVQCKRVMFDYL